MITPTTLRIHRIAETTVNPAALEFHTRNPGVTDAEHLAEFAGRSCYESWSRPREATANTADYIERTVHEQAHHSIIEHASVTYYITGVSRSLTHELIRHRHFSFSQRSQRYVGEVESGLNVVLPPALLEAFKDDGREFEDYMEVSRAVEGAARVYTDTVDFLEGHKGYSRKQAREAARAFLPNMTETRIVLTGNLRAWMEFLNKRDHPAADREIRDLAQALRADLHEYAPSIIRP